MTRWPTSSQCLYFRKLILSLKDNQLITSSQTLHNKLMAFWTQVLMPFKINKRSKSWWIVPRRLLRDLSPSEQRRSLTTSFRIMLLNKDKSQLPVLTKTLLLPFHNLYHPSCNKMHLYKTKWALLTLISILKWFKINKCLKIWTSHQTTCNKASRT